MLQKVDNLLNAVYHRLYNILYYFFQYTRLYKEFYHFYELNLQLHNLFLIKISVIDRHWTLKMTVAEQCTLN